MKLPEHPRIHPLTVKHLLALKLPEVYSVSSAAMVSEALAVMAEHDVGAVVVLDGERVVGMFSERDYARMGFVAAGMADGTRVSHRLTPCEVFATPSQTAQRCLEMMNENRVSYLPVIDDGRLLGLLSIGDLLHEIIVHYERIFQAHELDQRILFLQGTYSC